MKRKIFIPSKGRAEKLKASSLKVFPEAVVVVHNEKEYDDYRKVGIEQEIIISNVAFGNVGKALQLNYLLDNHIEDGEWVVMADDDVMRIEAVHPSYYYMEKFPESVSKHRNKLYQTSATGYRLERMIDEFVEHAEERNANLCGFTTMSNYFFRQTKWQYVGFILGITAVLRKTELRYPVKHIEDAWMTLEHLRRDGLVIINKFAMPVHRGWYHLGGHGTVAERYLISAKEMQEIAEKYEGLVYLQQRTDADKQDRRFGTNVPGEVKMKIGANTIKKVAEWRRANGHNDIRPVQRQSRYN